MKLWGIMAVASCWAWICQGAENAEIPEAHRLSLHLCETYFSDGQLQGYLERGLGRSEACGEISDDLFPADAVENPISGRMSDFDEDFPAYCGEAVKDGAFCAALSETVKRSFELIYKWQQPKDDNGAFPFTAAILVEACLSVIEHDGTVKAADGICAIGTQRGLLPLFLPDPDIVKDDKARRAMLEGLFAVGMTSAAMKNALDSHKFRCRADGEKQVCEAETAVIGFRDGRLDSFGGVWWSVTWHADGRGIADSVQVYSGEVSL